MNLLYSLDVKTKCARCERTIYGGKYCLGCKALNKKEAQKRRYQAKKNLKNEQT